MKLDKDFDWSDDLQVLTIDASEKMIVGKRLGRAQNVDGMKKAFYNSIWQWNVGGIFIAIANVVKIP